MESDLKRSCYRCFCSCCRCRCPKLQRFQTMNDGVHDVQGQYHVQMELTESSLFPQQLRQAKNRIKRIQNIDFTLRCFQEL
jgi:hypothetical protein